MNETSPLQSALDLLNAEGQAFVSTHGIKNWNGVSSGASKNLSKHRDQYSRELIFESHHSFTPEYSSSSIESAK